MTTQRPSGALGETGRRGTRPARMRGRNALQVGLWTFFMGSAALVVLAGFTILQALG